ncbi:MAG: serine hydrolase domain-containing protein [Acidimicrobiales bacterium]
MDVLPGTAQRLLARSAAAQTGARLPSLAAGVVRDGALAWFGARGHLDGRRGPAPDPDTQYRIGSITKTLTAIAVLRLRDEGCLSLDDALDTHLPGTPFGAATIGQLLAHRGGLQAETAGSWWERTPGGPWADVAGALDAPAATHAALAHPTGVRFHYSNLGFGALGQVVAGHRGRPWFEVVHDEVLAPLGMTRTTYHPVSPRAEPLAVHPDADLVQTEPTVDTGAMAAAGQLWATVADLARLGAFLLDGADDVLAADTRFEMKAAARTRTGEDRPAYGYGVQLFNGRDGHRRYGHGGSMPGYVGALTVDDDARLASVWLANSTYGGDWALGGALLDLVAEHEPPLPGPWRSAPPPAGVALELLGTWCWGPHRFTLRAIGSTLLELRSHGDRGASRFHAEPPHPASAGSAADRRSEGAEWVGLDGYYAGERLRFADDGRSFDLATFVFTRSPYGDGPVPGGVDPAGWIA